MSQDIFETGAWGDATIATAQKGEQILKHIVGRLGELVEEIAQFELSHLQPTAVDPLQQG
ncbi:MAG: hypothetical protein V7K67_21780 [Nostoc sp.]|uniref:hypothetical protein n=1 Tax=Nostoc sp. TaxID=1180 RepID=UPI002FFBC271